MIIATITSLHYPFLLKMVPVAVSDGLTIISEMILFGSSSCYKIEDNCHHPLNIWDPKFVQLNRTSSVNSLKWAIGIGLELKISIFFPKKHGLEATCQHYFLSL